MEVLIRTTTDVKTLPNDTGIQKSEDLCQGLATAKQTLAPGMWHFLTGIGQVSKLVLTVLRQQNMWTRICP